MGPADRATGPHPRGDRPPGRPSRRPVPGPPRSRARTRRGRRGRPPRGGRRARHARVRAVGGSAPRARRRPALRRPPRHAAAVPPGRRAGLDRLGGRVDRGGPGQLAQPAALHAEQVLGEPHGGDAGRRRARPGGDARDRRDGRARRSRDPADPADLAPALSALLDAPGGERGHARTVPGDGHRYTGRSRSSRTCRSWTIVAGPPSVGGPSRARTASTAPRSVTE